MYFRFIQIIRQYFGCSREHYIDHFSKKIAPNLFRVGRNVAAGMTGGLAYILDEDDTLIPKVFAPHSSQSLPIIANLVFFPLHEALLFIC